METSLLEEIGLTKGEIAVYFALLELGSSTVGPIIDKAKISSSKVYDILNRLIDKGLASFVIEANKNHYEAASPKRILDYIEEKKNKLNIQEKQMKQMLPELELKQKLKDLTANAQIYKGSKGALTAFRDITSTLEKGEELLVIGTFSFDPEFKRIVINFQKERAEKGIKAKFLVNRDAMEVGKEVARIPNSIVKYLPKGISTPAVFLIYKNKTIISLPNQRTFCKIDSEDSSKAFRAYFDNMWNQETEVSRGIDAVKKMWEETLKYPELKFIGARGYFVDKREKDFLELSEKAKKLGRRWKNIVDEGARDHILNKQEVMETRYFSGDFVNPNVVWIFGNTVAIVNWAKNEPIIFRIENKNVVDSYEKYFELLWNQETKTLKGSTGIKNLCEEVLKEKSDLYLIGANASIMKTLTDYFKEWDKKRVKAGIKRHHLSVQRTKNSEFNKLPNTEVKYLPKEFESPLIIWVFGNKVAHVLWEREQIVFMVDNEKVAEDYRKYYALLSTISQ